MTAERRYRCPACNARMTFGRVRCDSCNEESPVYNRRGFWPGLWLPLAMLVAAGLALLIVA